MTAMVALTGCQGSAPDEPTASPSSSPTASSAGAPTSNRTIPPGFIECDGRPPKDGAPVADVDLTAYTDQAPDGFVAASGYGEDLPVEGDWVITAYEPLDQAHGLDVLGMVVYPQMDLGPLTVTCDEISWADLEARVDQYDVIREATGVEQRERTTVAGLPAIREVVKLPRYTYEGYWIFGRGQVAHAYCQWAVNETQIRQGCQQYLATLVFEEAS